MVCVFRGWFTEPAELFLSLSVAPRWCEACMYTRYLGYAAKTHLLGWSPCPKCAQLLIDSFLLLLLSQTLEEPPYLTVGTDVSAKYRGAFCEAKIKTAKRLVKAKVSRISKSFHQRLWIKNSFCASGAACEVHRSRFGILVLNDGVGWNQIDTV